MNIVHLDFQGNDMEFRDDGWFNATAAAAIFGKRLQDWLDNRETQGYIASLARFLNHANQRDLIRASRGHNGGTWMHPKLAVPFARWLSVDFAIWCDDKIDKIIRGQGDWKRARHEATSSHKVMAKTLQMVRAMEGKETQAHHYQNESKLTNWAIGGEFAGLDRERLTESELDRLAATEIENAVMLGARMAYSERKAVLAGHREQVPDARALPIKPRQKRLPKAAA
ncbi:KilA-N domain-containing protein [Lysobacter capsici]|uniref:KilA-N domain-containing protein n=1 Tax=Lysobacter capsici TaxID=435897 RepID=UPI001C004077|nr:KilA-N domain-containing protein [Lysobacter capsici]QWF19306.1 KilA-N domain-containing protein [Lysobacter capsici]